VFVVATKTAKVSVLVWAFMVLSGLGLRLPGLDDIPVEKKLHSFDSIAVC